MNDQHESPRATSLDGRVFRFTGLVGDAALAPGTFVRLSDDQGTQVGQVEDLTFVDHERVGGSGTLLGSLSQEGAIDRRQTRPFARAAVERADTETADGLFTSDGLTLDVGAVEGAEGVRARLLARRFNRHTFWCGQSGSGKTYALGVLLEQLLINTSLPMVIFDPNADFVRLNELRGAADDPAGHALADRDIRVFRAGAEQNRLVARFADFPMRAKAAVLRLDPIADRAEYNALVHFDQQAVYSNSPESVIPNLLSSNDPASAALARRIENLRLIDWEVWAERRESVTDVIDTRPDATVLDLGGFSFPDEHLVIALAVLDDLWAKREQRRPVLLVIDEAHNLCAPDDERPLARAVRERIIQIAAEGRKFGLWLLLSTQRPSKVHPNIISQCDNLALMRMSSPLDLDELGTIFGFAPRALLSQAPQFHQGEALLAGGFVPAPMLVTVRDRLTVEGGADVTVPIR